jgi:DNA repair exonuclease SbcCD ATPase subunit
MRPTKLRVVNFLSHENSLLEIHHGKPTILVGKNTDDQGQEGNGSGKSALIEGIAFALLGQPLRAVKMPELVRRGATEMLIELELISAHEHIHITRAMVSGRASTISVYVDGTPVIQPTVQAYNEWVLQRLGFTRQDLLDYFLITKDRHLPFLSQPDAQKKQILSRFTKLEALDKLTLALPGWVQETEVTLQQQKLLLSKEQASLDLAESLLEKWSEEALKKAKEEKQLHFIAQQETWQIQKEKLEENIKILSSELNSYVLPEVTELNNLSEKETALLNELNVLISVIQELQELGQSIRNDFNQDKLTLTTKIDTLINKKIESRSKVYKLQDELGLLTTLSAQAVTCPSCQHVFLA